MRRFTTFETQLGESVVLTDKAKLSLYKKSQNSGYSVDILEEVYRRGYICWTEAFGGNADAFAFDRVNSFLADGFAAQLDEDLKKACWKGYEAIGMKKKNGKTVPNCVPVKEDLKAVPSPEAIAKKFKKSEDAIEKAIKSGSKVEKEHTRDQKTAEKIATAHVNELPDYYKKLNKAGLEEDAEKHSKNPDDPASRFIGSDELTDIYKKETPGQTIKRIVREAALDAAHGASPQAQGLRQTTRLGRTAPTFQQSNIGNQGLNKVGQDRYSASSRANLSGRRVMTSGSTQATAKTLTPQRVSANQPAPKTAAPTSAPKPTASFGKTTGAEARATSSGLEKSPGFKLSSGMSDAGKAKVKPTAPVEIPAAAGKAAGVLGKLARVATGPAATAAATVMEPTPAGEKKSEFQRQADVAKGISYKAQGRSVSDYEKQVLTPKTYEKPANPKVDAPTPPSRPEYFSRGQAFSAAREKAGGGQGQFTYDNKPFQTNVQGEPYIAPSKQKQTGIESESGGKVKKIKEAISEATYKGKTVPLNKPMAGDVKKSKVFVDPDGDGKAQKVNFGDKNMSIKKDQPARKKSYCARSGGQGNLTDKTSANYWSRRAWNCEETEVNELSVPAGTTGKRKEVSTPSVAVRMASGKIEKHPPGKSGSSGGGDE